MLGLFKWIVTGLFWGVVALVLLYTLPQRDVAYITGVEVKREDVGENPWFWAANPSGSTGVTTRDVRFIDTVQANGRVKVYRNEDTGWNWPPYFKFSSGNLQARMRALASTSAEPSWVVIRHYGWREELFSIYPNAVGVREIERPNANLGLPWFNIIFLTGLALLVGALHIRWRRFKARRLDPMGDAIEDRVDMASQSVSDSARGIRRWWRGLGR